MKLAHIWDVLVVNYVATIKALSSKLFFTFCELWHCFQVLSVLFLQVFGGFLPWPSHHVVDTKPKCKYGALNLWLQ
jgi:hypothetical protein